METRVAAGVMVLVALSLGAVLAMTIRVVLERSVQHAREDLEAAHITFARALDARASHAATLTRLVTELPVFRAHMTDSRLRADTASVEAMADRYRRELGASFAIVADAHGVWLGSPGWRSAAERPPALASSITAAVDGRAGHVVLPVADRLFLVTTEPMRFGDEVLGVFSVGYALDDRVARELAATTHCEVSLRAGERVSGSSLTGPRRAALERWMRESGPEPAHGWERWSLAGEHYVGGIFPLAQARGDSAVQLILLQDWSATQQFVDGLEERFLAAAAVTFGCALVAGLIFSRRISGPLSDLVAASRDIAAGDWQRRVRVRGTAEAETLAAAFNDMSASLRRAHDRLLHDAFHDPLTTLPNRALFMDRLQQAVARHARRPDASCAVLFIDLDRFKTVNDSIGHAAGDRLLCEMASRLGAALRASDTVARTPAIPGETDHETLARLGGDEFTILLEDIRDPSGAVRVAERLQQAVGAPVVIDGQTLFPSASIGIAISSEAHRSADDLVRDADLAMHRAKAAGGDRCAVFDESMHEGAVERLQLEIDLRRAIERDELRLTYQPIVAMTDRRTAGFEALLRWQHPVRGLLSPAAFLGVAEQTGLIGRIDMWVLRRACEDARRWQPADGAPVTVSVNISAQGFGRPDLAMLVSEILSEVGLPAACLRLEITETVAMADAERTRSVLSALKGLGVRISLDDFGTGYSSLSYLQRFPVDTLKIDRSFVAAVDENEECREIVRTVLNLAITLGLDVVAEGVETTAQLEYLDAMRCSYGQGYLFSKPLTIDQALAEVGEPRQDRVA